MCQRVSIPELLLASIAACMLKGIERVAPMLKFNMRGVEVRLHGIRQDVPPRCWSASTTRSEWTQTSQTGSELLHDNVRKYGTVFNTVSPGTQLNGVLQRR